jgi:hypothetical protein
MKTSPVARSFVLPVLLCIAALASGCSVTTPRYTASLANVQKLKDSDIQPIKVGTFQPAPGLSTAKSISLRGNSVASPYDSSYATYLAQALTQELSLAGRLEPDAQIEVSGVLQKNDISIPFSTGSGDIAARFVVTRSGTVRYDQVKSIHDEWDSSFVGAIAIPRAQERYPVMVQKLLTELYDDPAFIQALK